MAAKIVEGTKSPLLQSLMAGRSQKKDMRRLHDIAIWYAIYAEIIRSKRAQWLNWPYARVFVDWFVNTSATSDAGQSVGVYSQLRMQYSGSSDILFIMTEADQISARTANLANLSSQQS